MKQFKLFGVLCFAVALIRCVALNVIPADYEYRTLNMVMSYSLIVVGFVFFLLSALNAKGIGKFARVAQFITMGFFVLNVSFGIFYNSIIDGLIDAGDFDVMSVYGAVSRVFWLLASTCTLIFLFASRMLVVWKVLIPIFTTIEFCFCNWGFNWIVSSGWEYSTFGTISMVISLLLELFWLLAFVTYPAKYWKE